MDTYATLTSVFQDVFEDDTLVPTPEMTAEDVEEWDSLSHVRLIVAIELAFGIKFAVWEVVGLKNIGDLVAVIERRVAAR